ncbi:MAG TPA: preprotein translocase subunit SecE [Anaerolineales bacterium]|nr:preprotein translocase subunit SecE [Anaerolineales bacterium]
MSSTKAQPEVKEPNALVRYYRETRGELNKVVWPTRQEAMNLTAIVLGVIVVGSLFLGAFDYIFGELVRVLIDLSAG